LNISQETYKGYIINLKDGSFRIDGVMRVFLTLDEAKKHVDQYLGNRLGNSYAAIAPKKIIGFG
jgi:hypothetical protein